MTKESLMKGGLTEEQANKIMSELESDYIAKTSYNTQAHELKLAEEKVRTTEEALKAFDGVDVKDLRDKVEKLGNDLKQKDKDHAAEIKQIRMGNAVDRALMDANAINSTAVRPFLTAFLEKAELAEDGTITGLADEINKLATTEGTSFLFHSTNPTPTISGAVPTNTGTGSPTPSKSLDQMTYSEMVAYQAAHPDAKF